MSNFVEKRKRRAGNRNYGRRRSKKVEVFADEKVEKRRLKSKKSVLPGFEAFLLLFSLYIIGFSEKGTAVSSFYKLELCAL